MAALLQSTFISRARAIGITQSQEMFSGRGGIPGSTGTIAAAGRPCARHHDPASAEPRPAIWRLLEETDTTMRRQAFGDYLEQLGAATTPAAVASVAMRLQQEIPDTDPDLRTLLQKASLAHFLVQGSEEGLRLALADVEAIATGDAFSSPWQPPRARRRRRVAAWIRLRRRQLRRGIPRGITSAQTLRSYLADHGLTERSIRDLPWYRHNRTQLEVWLNEALDGGRPIQHG